MAPPFDDDGKRININAIPGWKPYSSVNAAPLKPSSARMQPEPQQRGPSQAGEGMHLFPNGATKPRDILCGGGGGARAGHLPESIDVSWRLDASQKENVRHSANRRPPPGPTPPPLDASLKSLLEGKDDSKILWLSATGKRPPGVGTENEDQEIISAERTSRGVVLRLTLLASGFVVGPNGASIHQIESVSGAKVYSFNRHKDKTVERPTRQFHIEGTAQAVQHAVDIICHAVHLYKDLAEGNHCGMTVKRLHKMDAVLFRYEPPPRSKVPYAAQVEYDAAELKVLQETKGQRSSHVIKEVREQLARRDEALMRSNLSLPPSKQKLYAVKGRRTSLASIIDQSEPDVQNHDVVHSKSLIDAFEGLATAPTRAHINPRFGARALGAHAQQSRPVPYIPPTTHKEGLAQSSGHAPDPKRAPCPPYPVQGPSGSMAQGRSRSDRGTWKQGGLHGIDSIWR